MGTWGTGLRESDTALDALEEFKRDIARVSRDGRDPGELLLRVLSHFGEEGGEAVLAIIDLLLKRKRDVGDGARSLVRLILKDELRLDAIKEWRDPRARLESLLRLFALAYGRTPRGVPKVWRPAATKALREIEALLEKDMRDARRWMESVVRHAARDLRTSSPEERGQALGAVIGFRQGGAVDARLVEKVIHAVVAAGWTFPAGKVADVMRGVERPSWRRLLGLSGTKPTRRKVPRRPASR